MLKRRTGLNNRRTFFFRDISETRTRSLNLADIDAVLYSKNRRTNRWDVRVGKLDDKISIKSRPKNYINDDTRCEMYKSGTTSYSVIMFNVKDKIV